MEELYLTRSSMQSFQTCQEKYKREFIDYLTPKQRAGYFVIGDLVHLGLAVGNLSKDIDKVLETLTEYILTSFPEVKESQASDELQKQLSEAWRLIRAYFNHYGFESDIHDIETGRVKVQVGVIYKDQSLQRSSGTKIFYTGRKDAMKGNHILERKTAAALNKRQLSMFHKDPQTLGYMLLTPEADGCIYDMIIKTKTPQFHREEIIIPERYVDRYVKYILQVARDILTLQEHVKNDLLIRKNLFQCISLIGGECPFRPVCDVENEILKRDMIISYYNQATGPPDLRGYNGFLER